MNTKLRSLLPYLVLALLSLIGYLPLLMDASTLFSDYGHHIDVALALPESVKHISHVLYHAAFLLIRILLPSLTLQLAAVAALLTFMLPVPLIALWLFRKAANDALPDSLLMAFSLSLTIMAPVTIWTNHYMIGYFNPIVYHNPTMIALRLFLIPISLLAFRIFDSRSFRNINHRIFVSLLSAVLVLLATLTKPSYTLALIPSCCLLAIWRLLRRQYVDIPLLAIGVCLPGILLLGLLYLLVYFNYDDGSAVAVGFLTLMKVYIPAWRIPIQLILSLLFPLGIYMCFRKEARQHLYLNMSWLIFGVGAAIAFLLYEDGPRFAHGNFLWSGYSATFVLMFVSTLFFVERLQSDITSVEKRNFQRVKALFTSRHAVVALLFGLHVISGMAYYLRFMGIDLL